MSKPRKTHISKKTKAGWRKTDIQDVEEYLEEKRQEERIGSFDTKKDEELFVVDNTSADAKPSATEKQKRKLNAKKPFKAHEVFLNTSSVQDPIAKRNYVKKRSGRVLEEEVLNPTKARHFQANKDRLRSYENVEEKLRKRKACITEDIWTEKDFRDSIPGLKDEKGWVSRELAKHIANNVGKKVIKVHDGIRHRTTKLKKFEDPHPGTSYNPSLMDHQDLIVKVVEREEQIIKKENHLKRVTTQMFSKVTPEERDRRRIEEMSTGLDETDSKHDENDHSSNHPSNGLTNPPVQNKKKTKQERNRELRHKELLKKQEAKRALKQHIADLHRLKSLKGEVMEEEEKLKDLQKRRKQTALKKKFEPKRLGRLKYEDPDLDVNMAEDISGNLRNVKPETSLLIDRFKNFQKRNILPTSVATGKQKAKKIKRFVRNSHKDPGTSFEMLRDQRKKNKF